LYFIDAFGFEPVCLTLSQAYWKNFTLRRPDEIRLTFETTSQIGRRVQTRKRVKVMDEVRLIEIPTTARDVGPVYFGASLNLEQYFLKPANPAKQLWRQAGLSPEEVNKVFVAKPNSA